jgi:hypothetical protein
MYVINEIMEKYDVLIRFFVDREVIKYKLEWSELFRFLIATGYTDNGQPNNGDKYLNCKGVYTTTHRLCAVLNTYLRVLMHSEHVCPCEQDFRNIRTS